MKNQLVFRVFSVLLSLLMGVSLFLSAPAQPVSAAYWVVTKVADTSDGVCNADCSLREAIAAAGGSGDTITFANAIEGGTIILGSELVINKSVTIDNSNHAVIFTLDADWDHRIFSVNAGKWLTLKYLLFVHGEEQPTSVGGIILNNGGVVTIYDCVLNNSAAYHGGAIYNESGGTVNIYNSRIASSSALWSGGNGGAIYNEGTIGIDNSVLEFNHSFYDGGAIYNEGDLEVRGTTFKSNVSDYNSGGALYSAAGSYAKIYNSTFFANSSEYNGAAIKGEFLSDLWIFNSTITDGNAHSYVGGLYTEGNLVMSNTILANSAFGTKDCSASGGIKTFYNNLIEHNSSGYAACGTPVSTADPLLGPLETHHANTKFMPIPANSPAVDTGSDDDCLATDVRGVLRPFGAHCDIGAYEYALDPIITSLAPANKLKGSGGFTLTVNGQDFVPYSVVQWNGVDLVTAYVSPTRLTVTVTAGMVADVALALVTVKTEGVANPISDPLGFTVYTFADVLPTHPLWRYVEGFFARGITTGCNINPLRYCPDRGVTRAEMAVFILRAISPPGFVPTNIELDPFIDVPVAGKEWMEPWIEQFYGMGITTGCAVGPLRYCPERGVTRGEMAVFILRATHGPGWPPPPAVGIFVDVPATNWMQPWIEELYHAGITTGCSGSIPGVDLMYCPGRAVNRAEMATFVDRAFGFPPLP